MVYKIKIEALTDIGIGKELDSGTLIVVFDVAKWRNAYPELEHYHIEVSSPNGIIYIPADVRLENDQLIWTITDADTAMNGKGAYQIVAIGAGGKRKTSDSRSLYVGKIIDGTDAADPPEPSKPWVDAVLDAAKRAEEAAERAESAGGGSVTPEQIGQAVEDYLTKNPVEVTETDPNVPAWAKEANKPKYTAEEVGAQPKGDYALKSEIPSVPVQSVNGKTGNVQLTATDVGAASKETVERLSEEIAEQGKAIEGKQPKGDYVLKSEIPDISEEKLELLNTVSVDTEVADVYITTDSNGNPLKFTRCIIEIECGSTTGAYLYSLAGKLNNPGVNLNYAAIVYCYAQYTQAKIFSAMDARLDAGYWDMLFYAPGDRWAVRDIKAPPKDMYMRFGADGYPYLDMVRVYANTGGGTTVIPVGTTIKVWGVRANA